MEGAEGVIYTANHTQKQEAAVTRRDGGFGVLHDRFGVWQWVPVGSRCVPGLSCLEEDACREKGNELEWVLEGGDTHLQHTCEHK